jgi:hypothetical protein
MAWVNGFSELGSDDSNEGEQIQSFGKERYVNDTSTTPTSDCAESVYGRLMALGIESLVVEKIVSNHVFDANSLFFVDNVLDITDEATLLTEPVRSVIRKDDKRAESIHLVRETSAKIQKLVETIDALAYDMALYVLNIDETIFNDTLVILAASRERLTEVEYLIEDFQSLMARFLGDSR